MNTSHQTRTRLGLAVAGLAVALFATACGGSSGGTASTTGSGGVGAANTGAVHTAKGPLGTILVDGKGMTIYLFAPDKAGKSVCNGSCATYWPPVPAPATMPSSLPGVTGMLGTTTRDDGSSQLTVAGHPLYTYAGDQKPGQAKGQNQDINGGLWTVVAADGSSVTTSAGGGSGGGGY
jgi:predicted lipoprotein with Yx(FWY)xxD motif